MNSKSITNYILKLEHDNQDLSETVRTLEFDQIGLKKKIRDMVDTLDQVKKERDEGIGKLLDADIQRIGRVLNEPEKPSLFETTARVTQTSVNEEIGRHDDVVGALEQYSTSRVPVGKRAVARARELGSVLMPDERALSEWSAHYSDAKNLLVDTAVELPGLAHINVMDEGVT